MDEARILANALKQKDEKGIIALALIQNKNMIQTRNTLAILRYFQTLVCKHAIARQFINTVIDNLLQCVDHPVADTIFGLAGSFRKVRTLYGDVKNLDSSNIVKEEKYIELGVQWTLIMNVVHSCIAQYDAARQAEQTQS